jgi:hypothetical protein
MILIDFDRFCKRAFFSNPLRLDKSRLANPRFCELYYNLICQNTCSLQIKYLGISLLFRSHATMPPCRRQNFTYTHRHPHENYLWKSNLKAWISNLQIIFFMIFQLISSENFSIILFITIIQKNNNKTYVCIRLCGGDDGEGRPTSATYPWVVSVDLQNRMSTARKTSCRQNHGTDVFCMQN